VVRPAGADPVDREDPERRRTDQDLINGGAIQLGLTLSDLVQYGCQTNGTGCASVYAVSIPGVSPSPWLTWLAVAVARNSLKRLPINQEWQAAALGTPDPGISDDGSTTYTTNAGPFVLSATGSRSQYVSAVGAFDMVGNVWEWVADWVDIPSGCTTTFNDDQIRFGGPPASPPANNPGAMLRGGARNGGASAGVFAVTVIDRGSFLGDTSGFRCAR
jgi:formylglycine-generating enzyme required for sulfatase activity